MGLRLQECLGWPMPVYEGLRENRRQALKLLKKYLHSKSNVPKCSVATRLGLNLKRAMLTGIDDSQNIDLTPEMDPNLDR